VPDPVLDTNVLLRHITGDHPELSPRATAFLADAEATGRRLRVTETVVFEAVWALEKLYLTSRRAISRNLVAILDLPMMVLPTKARVRAAFALYERFKALSFADAYHVQTALDLSSGDIVSFDRDLSRVPGVRRIEPA
jgi:predicted nucleic acid-binding protein